jgi:Skp family chaperone for outer membrane proteins
MSELFNDEELKEHFVKVDKLVKYYMNNMDNELGTIQEALENLFSELGKDDLERAIKDLARKENKTLNLWNT